MTRTRRPNGPWTTRIRFLLTVAVMGAVPVACTGDGSDEGAATTGQFKPVIALAVNDWTASALNVSIAEQLIERHLGYPVEPTREDDATVMYQDLADGRIDAALEVWPSTVTERDRRFFDRGQVVELGPLGPVGQVGWYVPRYVLDAHPQVGSWTGFQDPATAGLFATDDTAPRGRFLGVDPGYRQHDEEIVTNLGLPLVVQYSGSEADTVEELARAAAAQEPILLYWWVPTAAASTYDLVRVTLPEPTQACLQAAEAGTGTVDCDYPPDPLVKVASPDLETKAPDVVAFLRAFTLSNDDQQDLLRAVETEGLTVAAAARRWIDGHEPVWRAWLQT